MARANASGTTWYIPEGHVVPNDVPQGVTLVGPGVEVEPEPVVEPEPEAVVEVAPVVELKLVAIEEIETPKAV